MILVLALGGCGSVFYFYFILMAFIQLQIFFLEEHLYEEVYFERGEWTDVKKKYMIFFHKKSNFSKNLKGKK